MGLGLDGSDDLVPVIQRCGHGLDGPFEAASHGTVNSPRGQPGCYGAAPLSY